MNDEKHRAAQGFAEMAAAPPMAPFDSARADAPDAATSARDIGLLAGAGSRALRGRGARSNRSGRHERLALQAVDDGWGSLAALARQRCRTEVQEERARSIITRNDSPDVGFRFSLNPYRGCEHGCIYCYARPGHAHLGLSPGLDFESRIIARHNAPELFEKALQQPRWQGEPIAIGTYTDCYQPAEKRLMITRRILQVAERWRQPVMLITKSRLVLRDLDILQRMARRRLVRVAISITTLDAELARRMEPRAATPRRRLEALARLAEAGVPTSVMVAPVIPVLTDHELEQILLRAAHAGAQAAGMVMLRLPLEIAELFREWLQEHFPDRARRVLALLREMHGGKLYDARHHQRMRGSGPHAWMIWRRFEITCRRLGLNRNVTPLDSQAFLRHRASRGGRQPLLPGIE